MLERFCQYRTNDKRERLRPSFIKGLLVRESAIGYGLEGIRMAAAKERKAPRGEVLCVGVNYCA
jgi:hypothetical protein